MGRRSVGMPIGLVRLRGTTLRGLIARSQKSRGASRRKGSRAELKSLQIRCCGASPIERSYRVPRRRGRPVLSVVSWPSSRGHSSRRTSRRLFILTLRGRERTRRRVEKENERRAPFPFAPSNVTNRAPFSLSCFCGCSRKLFLRHINSRWRAVKYERRSRDNDHDDARPILHSSSSLHQPVTSVHHSSLLRVFIRLERVSEARFIRNYIDTWYVASDFLLEFSLVFLFLSKC